MTCGPICPLFGKTRPLTVADFAEFEACFGNQPLGTAKCKDQGEAGRFRCFNRDQIAARNDNLDISWLPDTEADAEEQLTEPGRHRGGHYRPPQGGAGRYRDAVGRVGRRGGETVEAMNIPEAAE